MAIALKQDEILNKDSVAINKEAIFSEDRRAYNLISRRKLQAIKPFYATIATTTFDPIFGTYTGSTSVEHGLGYIPVFLAFYKDASSTMYTPLPNHLLSFAITGYKGFFGLNAMATSKTITFNLVTYPGLVTPLSPSTPYNIKCYVFRERIIE